MSELRAKYADLIDQTKQAEAQKLLDLWPEVQQDLQNYDAGDFAPETETSFLNKEFPDWVEVLLTNEFMHSAMQDYLKLTKVFKEIILFAIRHLHPTKPGLLNVISQVLNSGQKFYENNLHYSAYQIETALNRQWSEDTEGEDGPIICLIRFDMKTNSFYTFNLRLFGFYQGCQSLIDFIQLKPTVSQINQALAVFIRSRAYAQHTALISIASQLANTTLEVVRDITEEGIRATSKVEFEDLCRNLVNILDRVHPDASVGEILEVFELDLDLKLLTSPFLEKKIYAVSEINKKITFAKNKDENDRYPRPYLGPSYDTAKWLNSARLLNWMDKHNLFETLFGLGSHPEVIKRCGGFVAFLSKNHRFSTEQLDYIWDSALSRHEAHRAALSTILQELVRSLPLSDLQYLFDKVVNTPWNQIDSALLSMMQGITRELKAWSYSKPVYPFVTNEINVDKGTTDAWNEVDGIELTDTEVKPAEVVEERDFHAEALEFLWNLGQSQAIEQGLSCEIATESLNTLQELLKHLNSSTKFKFLGKCAQNIQKNSSVLSTLKLMEGLLNSYSKTAGFYHIEERVSYVIKQLNAQYDLVSELFNSFLLFKIEAAEAAREIAQEKPPDEAPAETFSTCSSCDGSEEYENRKQRYETIFKSIQVTPGVFYLEELRIRLKFFQKIFKFSEDPMNRKQLEVLWETMVLHAATESDQNEFFNWVAECLDQISVNSCVLNDEMVYFLFADLLLTLDPRYYSPSAFTCFKKVFIYINKKHGMLIKYDYGEEYDFKSDTLIGLPALWDLALLPRDSGTSQTAKSLLKNLYRGVSDWTPEKQQDLLTLFTSYLKSAASQLQERYSVDVANLLHRLMNIILEFIEEFEGQALQLKGRNLELVIKDDTWSEQSSFVVTVHTQMTVGELTTLVFAKFPKESDDYLKLSAGITSISDEPANKTIEELHLQNRQVLNVTRQYYHSVDTLDLDEPRDKPKLIENLKCMFGYDTRLLQLALEKSYWRIEQAVELLTNDYCRENLERQLNSRVTRASALQLSKSISSDSELFKMLFDLLEHGISSLNSLIWDLLRRIPLNAEMTAILGHLPMAVGASQPPWSDYLDSRNAYKLLYGLQIVSSLLDSSGTTQWKHRFVGLGGFLHLYQTFLTWELSSEPGNAECLSKLLNVLKAIVADHGSFAELGDIDYSEFLNKLLASVEFSLKCVGDAVLVTTQLELMVFVLLSEPQLLPRLEEVDLFRKLVLGLLNSDIQETRTAIKTQLKVIVSLCTSYEHSLKTLMVECIPHDQNKNCEEFFGILNKLIKKEVIGSTELLEQCVDFIRNREMLEHRRNTQQDKVLTGHFLITNSLLTTVSNPPKHIEQLAILIYNMLFEVPEHPGPAVQNSPPLCKHEKTRTAAFALLITLCRVFPASLQDLFSQLASNHSALKLESSSVSQFDTKNYTGYVGLKNFGSTCYMNSLLQQFFMMPVFRKTVMGLEVSETSDNILYELQWVFAYLQESEKEYFAPLTFFKSFKGMDGKPMNQRMQQDVDEFFNLLCDRLEQRMKDTPQASILRHTFGGSFFHEIASLEAEYPYKNTHEEQFMRISLEIKNKKSLAEALDLFVKADILDGDNKYLCEKHDQKIDVSKRCLIGKLANTVFIHLKRFEFDFNTMQRFKINDSCEFPAVLDFKPWSAEGLDGADTYPEDYYKFELVGVLVHSGVAEAGHYYSLIKERDSSKWLKFDDRIVTEFDINTLQEECYGGTSVYNWQYNETFATTRSAYMLVYERVIPFGNDQPPNQENLPILKQVWAENMEFLRDLLFFDESYMEFLKQFIELFDFKRSEEVDPLMSSSEDFIKATSTTQEEAESLIERLKALEGEPSLQLIKLSTLFSYEILVKTGKTADFLSWIRILQNLYSQHSGAALWLTKFFTAYPGILIEVLLESTAANIRSAFAEFIAKVVEWAIGAETDLLFEDVQLEIEGEPYKEYPAATARFIKLHLREIYSLAQKNWKKYDEYLLVIQRLAQAGSTERQLLLHLGALDTFVSFFMSVIETYLAEKQYYDSDPVAEPSLNVILETVGLLLEEATTVDELPGQLQYNQFYTHLLKHVKKSEVENILYRLAMVRLDCSTLIIQECLKTVLEFRTHWFELNPYLRLLARILSNPDANQAQRIKLVFEYDVEKPLGIYSGTRLFQVLNQVKDHNIMFVSTILLWLDSLLVSQPIVDACIEHSCQLKWICTYPNSISYRIQNMTSITDYRGSIRNLSRELERIANFFRTKFQSDDDSSDTEPMADSDQGSDDSNQA